MRLKKPENHQHASGATGEFGALGVAGYFLTLWNAFLSLEVEAHFRLTYRST